MSQRRTKRSRADGPVFHEPRQVVGERSRRRVPLPRLARSRLQDDRLQVARDRAVDFSRPNRLVLHHPPREPVALRVFECGLEGQELIERQPQAIKVGANIARPRESLGGR